MSRVTKVELEGYELRSTSILDEFSANRLIAEIRRLRALIDKCEVQSGAFLPHDFEAEQEAIRSERP